MTKSYSENIHATLLVMDEKGVLLRGTSGSGKSSLAYMLIDQSLKLGRFACIVADDRVVINRVGDRLIGTCPTTIQGYMEVYGAGITLQKSMSSCIIDFCFDICNSQRIERMQDESFTDIMGILCPLANLSANRPLETYNLVRSKVDATIVADA